MERRQNMQRNCFSGAYALRYSYTGARRGGARGKIWAAEALMGKYHQGADSAEDGRDHTVGRVGVFLGSAGTDFVDNLGGLSAGVAGHVVKLRLYLCGEMHFHGIGSCSEDAACAVAAAPRDSRRIR